MVQSILDPTIIYPELSSIDPEDKGKDKFIYEVSIRNRICEIALGLPKYAFVNKAIIYFPIYLVEGDRINSQIGLYEIEENRYLSVIDKDGDLVLSEIDKPLLYEKSKLLNWNEIGMSFNKWEQENKETEDEADEVVTIQQLQDKDMNTIEEVEVTVDTDDETDSDCEYVSWVQEYMHSCDYMLVDNEGGGDCLFAAIRDGLETIGKTLSVSEMRSTLANAATEDIFQLYKEQYNIFAERKSELDAQIKPLRKRNAELREQAKNLVDKEQKMLLKQEAIKIKSQYNNLQEEKRQADELLAEFSMMKGVKSLSDFKNIIKTCKFWGDVWAISMLEAALNIKLILLSEEAYLSGDIANVLICSEAHQSLQERGIFRPTDYIILGYTGNHYMLITYQNMGALQYNELSSRLKNIIIEKCLERGQGSFALIPEFKGDEEKEDDIVNLATLNEEISNLNKETFDPNIIFRFYERSHHAKPGKGAGEEMNVSPAIQQEYMPLDRIKDWRRQLSNAYISPIIVDGKRWASVENYIQAAKFKEDSPEFYASMALDNNSLKLGDMEGETISTNPFMARAIGNQNGKYKGKLIRPKEVVIDKNWSEKKRSEALRKAQYAKYDQYPALKDMLLKTKDAKLMEFVRGSEPIIYSELMTIREEMK